MVSLGKNISPEVMAIIANLDDAGRLGDLSASNLELRVEDAQSVLEIADTTARLRRVNEILNKEIEVLSPGDTDWQSVPICYIPKEGDLVRAV